MSGAQGSDVQVLSTLNADGSRRWLRPRVSPGRFLNRRKIVGYGLILFFCGLPHLRINGKPPILLDLLHREFTFFGVTLYPTDTLLFALLMLVVFLSIFFLTALFGRVWCGWGCPQTVYLEFVYRPIERFFEGAPGRKRKTGAWRKPAKLVMYLLVSFLLANTFIAYFVGTDDLFRWMRGSPFTHPVPFLVMAITTFLMMFDFAFFREQVCIVACPYGRMQSVMLDRNSLIITYDEKRGEPRGKKKRAIKSESDVSLRVLPEEQELGDCIDCKMCVTTCPTGIDIRDGLQMECVNCAQCIDACDDVMDKIGRPRGLIRYGSQASVLDGKKSRILRPRTMVYPAIVAGLLMAFTFVLVTRAPAYISVLRQRGAPFAVLDDGSVVNAVTVKVQNRRPEDARYDFELVDVDGGKVEIAGEAFVVRPQETVGRPVLLKAPASSFPTGARNVIIRVRDEDGYEKDVKYRMMAPTYRPTNPGEASDEEQSDG